MIVVDYYADKEIVDSLKKIDRVLLTKPSKLIYEGINGHPDLLIRQLDKELIAVDENSIKYYKDYFKNYKLIPISSIKSPYPNHIKLNYVVFKNYFIHNLKYTDKKILNFYKEKNYEFIDVKQGYTKCNIVVGKNSLITSDNDIYIKLKDKFPTLLIDHKQIKLKNFNYGFIGGTSGLINDILYFTGRLERHSSYKKILRFLDKNKEDYKFLTDKEIVDVGSLMQMY